MSLNWNGKELKTMGELQDAILAIVKFGSRHEAKMFMKQYGATFGEDIAKGNVGYIAGYFDRETSEKIWEWFGCSHPIFGKTYVDPDTAFRAGKFIGGVEKRRRKAEERDL